MGHDKSAVHHDDDVRGRPFSRYCNAESRGRIPLPRRLASVALDNLGPVLTCEFWAVVSSQVCRRIETTIGGRRASLGGISDAKSGAQNDLFVVRRGMRDGQGRGPAPSSSCDYASGPGSKSRQAFSAKPTATGTQEGAPLRRELRYSPTCKAHNSP